MLKQKRLFLLFTIISLQMLFAPPGFADYFIPKVVTIENGQRAASITILNRSNYAKVYEFEWEHRVQLPDGTRDILEDGETMEGYRPADPYLVFSPRRVIVQPGQSQKLRIMARRTADMEPGEYRSHLVIKPDRLNKIDAPETAPQGFSGIVELKTNISMPIFLRHGKTILDFDYTDIQVSQEDGVDVIKAKVINNGTRSTYALNTLECTTGDQKKEYPINKLRVYIEAPSVDRAFKFRKGMPNLAECDSANLNVYASHDFEYKRDKPIRIYKLK